MGKAQGSENFPRFIIAGAAKSGTSSLSGYLDKHPAIFMPPHEMNYFAFADNDYRFSVLNNTLIKTYQHYLSFYKHAGNKIPGEKSVSYLYIYWVDRVIRNILTIHPLKEKVRIIILLRQPVERMYSQYLFNRHSHETLPFDEAVAAWPRRREKGWVPAYDYLGAGYYTYAVRQYMQHFEQVKVLLFDDLQKDPAFFYHTIAAFLGIDSRGATNPTGAVFNQGGLPKNRFYQMLYGVIRSKTMKKLSGTLLPQNTRQRFTELLKRAALAKPSLSQQQKKHYNKYFTEDITTLESLIHRDLSSWK